jgi:hypothetical protein
MVEREYRPYISSLTQSAKCDGSGATTMGHAAWESHQRQPGILGRVGDSSILATAQQERRALSQVSDKRVAGA